LALPRANPALIFSLSPDASRTLRAYSTSSLSPYSSSSFPYTPPPPPLGNNRAVYPLAENINPNITSFAAAWFKSSWIISTARTRLTALSLPTSVPTPAPVALLYNDSIPNMTLNSVEEFCRAAEEYVRAFVFRLA
jgi:hypothetical protein